ncbi:copper chaperone PCu(A)C [Kordiimonas marina]|uniref:copper chaperone PCu(A)C n=1 Tax=Kordiimonas marina TaxID=2872312 RepID=UPI001FF315B8|nr:copper chaperone PCu(A)C [Kordiimonas marina]MCJ9428380.1 copper chaperone PCu(A)C [Kordiimonas marina]
MLRLTKLFLIGFMSLGLLAPQVSSAEAHAGPGATHSITIGQPWARQTGNRTMSAAVYLSIHNGTEIADTVTDVSTPLAKMAQVHRSYEKDGIMHMDHVPNLPIAPGETLTFSPGGYHIMMMHLTKPLKEGDVFPMTLHFTHAGDVQIYVEVTGIAGPKK